MKHFDESIRSDIQAKSCIARAAILSMTSLAGSGHPGGSMSCIDILLSIYHGIKHDPKKPNMSDRDRVVVSNGHISPAVYSALALNGYFNIEDAISQFRKIGSIFEGHIERTVPGVEWSTGNLGQGLSAGAGMALASKLKEIPYRVFVLMGDGEQQKGQISEARRFATKYKLGNLIAIVDYNRLQISGCIDKVMPQNIRHNYESDGWQVMEINGHDIKQIEEAISSASNDSIPTLILAHTVMGKGVSFMENKEKYHGSTLSDDQLQEALKELNQPNKMDEYKYLRKTFTPNPSEHSLEQFTFVTDLVPGKPKLYETETDNRSAWGTAIADLAELNAKASTPIAVLDCDLQASVKTGEFEKISPKYFIQSGIMEHNTSVVAGALSTCNIQTFWADFGVFGLAEVYNMQRLNDINHANLKVILTHVGCDVGEDGKTHQSIDYINLVRNLFGFRIICPADPNQTDRIIRWLINKPGNYIVAMGRSKLPIIKDEMAKPFYGIDYNYDYGKEDIIRDGKDCTIYVCGTLVGSAVKAVDILRQEGVYARLIYVSSPLSIDAANLSLSSKTQYIFSVEDHSINGGLGTSIAEKLIECGYMCQLHKIGAKDYPVSGNSSDLFQWMGMDANSIVKSVINHLHK